VALLKSGELVVAFRPTEASSLDPDVTTSDWATDFDIRMVAPTAIYGVSVGADGADWRVSCSTQCPTEGAV
jgi:hypothetical protein